MCVFFFKQKTAYEMRISDWSADVCSSDLAFSAPSRAGITLALENLSKSESTGRASNDKKIFWHRWYPGPDEQPPDDSRNRDARGAGGGQALPSRRAPAPGGDRRSEERRVGKEWGSTFRSRGSP